MATVKSYFPDEMAQKAAITQESIIGSLMYFYNCSLSYHLQSDNHTIHKAMGKLHTCLLDKWCEIGEKLMGYTGRRMGPIKVDPMTPYTPQAATLLCQKVIEFGDQLSDWGDTNDYPGICSYGADISAVGAHIKYDLTFA